MRTQFKYGWLTLGAVVLLNSAAVVHGQTCIGRDRAVQFQCRRHANASRDLPDRGDEPHRRDPVAGYRDGHSIMVNAALPKGGEAKTSKLVFRCYGGNCFLSEVWYRRRIQRTRPLSRQAGERNRASGLEERHSRDALKRCAKAMANTWASAGEPVNTSLLIGSLASLIGLSHNGTDGHNCYPTDDRRLRAAPGGTGRESRARGWRIGTRCRGTTGLTME